MLAYKRTFRGLDRLGANRGYGVLMAEMLSLFCRRDTLCSLLTLRRAISRGIVAFLLWEAKGETNYIFFIKKGFIDC